jgi:hypothetical protein
MTVTRWKLTAGALGLAVGGLAATADPPCPAPPLVTRTCHRPEPPRTSQAVRPVLPAAAVGETVQAAFQPPAVVAPPAPADAPQVAPVAVQPVAVNPPLPTAAAEPPKLEVPPITVAAPMPTKPEPPKLDLPKPAPTPEKVVEIPLPAVAAVKPAEPVPAVPEVKLAPPAVGEPVLLPKPAADLPPPHPAPTRPARVADDLPAVAPARPEPAAPPPSLAAPPVRVVLKIGSGQPRFDVLAGDDTLLKVVCDRVDVRSPSDRGGDGMTPLKAAGGVRFSAPGCDGTADELTVLSATGEVLVAGNVQVRCRRGKGETQFKASEMRFRLGTAPAYTVADPAPGPLQARTAFTPGRK